MSTRPVGGAAAAGVPASLPPAPQPSRMPLLIGGLVLAMAAGGLAAYEISRPAGTVDVKPRAVKLVVLPAGATVEVDGKAAAVDKGVVEISGALGSVHKVRIAAGGAETTGEVVVTESGAAPAKMELAPPPESPTAAPATAAPTTPDAPATDAPSATAPAPPRGGPLPPRPGPTATTAQPTGPTPILRTTR
jgi:serine/threonine-protein kinase